MINATACILIGGKSKRFGSTKWKAKLGSKSVIEHIWSASSEFKFQYLVGKTKPKNIKEMFIEDLFDFQAPIIGLVSSIKSSKTDWILLLSCDLPLIDKDSLRAIWNSSREKYDAVIPIVNGYRQPLCGLYHKRIKKKLDMYIAKKNLSLNFFLESINCNFICISDNEQTFINMNTKEDFEKVKRIFELYTTK